MSRIIRMLSVAAALALPLILSAQAPAKAPLAKSDMVSVVATVEAIDTKNREVTLKGPDGNFVTMQVPESVKRFSAMKVGDHVKVKYYESVAIEVHKAGQAVPGTKVESGVTKAAGEKPAGTATRRVTVTVTITAIDAKTPAVTVKGEDGHTMSFRVEDPKNLEGVKVGDHVSVTYTEALAIEVSEPKS